MSKTKGNPYLKTLPESNPVKLAKKPKPVAATLSVEESAERERLRAEILALGGDEEDLRMIQAVEGDSDSEVENEPAKEKTKGKKGKDTVDATLSKDLRDLFKSLDFAAAGAAPLESEPEDDAAADEEDEEDSDDDEDSDDESESEEEAQAVVPVPVKPTKAKADKVESKREREDRRIEERTVEKEKEKLDKAALREERATAKPIITKSPWVIDPTPQWYSVPLPSLAPSASRPSAGLLDQLQKQSVTLLARENALYASSLAPRAPSSAPPPPNGLSKADQVFIQQILTTGTSSDKLSALLLLVSSSPLHTMAYLDQIVVVCKKKSREESGRAIRGVVEWWRGGGGDGGGSPSRKLRSFADQPGLETLGKSWQALEATGKGRERKTAESELTKEECEQCLVIWAFEDWLKKWFFEVLKCVEQMSVDPLPHPRTLAVVHLSNLLRDKPEQEGNILRLLVNKLGDSQRSIASKTSHHLLQILQFHPGMTSIMVREVSALVLRPTMAAPAASGTSHVRFGKDKEKDEKEKAKEKVKDNGQDHARYYGVITLNQVMLNRNQADVAGKMIEVYFEIFGDILGRVKEDDELVLPGAADEEKEDKFEKPKYVKGGKGKGGKGKKDDPDAVPEVGETDSKLVAAVLTGVNRAFPFAKIEEEAFKKRLDTLFRITHTGTFNVSIQALMLIYHVSAAKRAVSDRFYRALYTSLYDPRLAGSSKQALYLNLVFKAMKQDPNPRRVMALIKRLVQVMLGMEVTFILGSIWIVGELMATIPGLRTMLTEAEDVNTRLLEPAADADASTASRRVEDDGRYDGKKREPAFAHAENSCLWELVPLLQHYHPSVVLHAEQLLAGSPISAAADLEQHSLNHFLDRFVYRDVKKNIPTKGSSMMQSGVPGQDGTGRIVMKKGPARGEDSMVNSEGFRAKDVTDVPVDQLFFHKYFSSKTAQQDDKVKNNKKRKSRKGQDDSSDEDSIADLGFSDQEDDKAFELSMKTNDVEDEEDDSDAEEAIWKAMKASMPKAKGDDDMMGEEEDDDSDVEQYNYSDSDEDPAAGSGDEVLEDVPFKSAFGDDSDGSDDVLGEDEDDLLGSDDDMPLFIGDPGDQGEGSDVERKQASKSQERRKKKQKLNSLPMFATAEDYAHLLGGEDDDNI